MRPPRRAPIGSIGMIGVVLGLLAGAGPSAAGPAPMPPAELMASDSSCAMPAGRTPGCVRDLATGLAAYFGSPGARIAWWRTTRGRLPFVSPSQPEGKRAVYAVLAVGDLAWPAGWGPGQIVPGDRGLIFEIDVRTARIVGFGGTRAALAKLGPGRRLN